MFLGRILAQIDGLTTDQIQQIRVVLEGARPEFHDLRIAFVTGTISAEELRDRAKALRERIEGSLRSILTAEQFAAFEAALAEHRAEMASRRLATLAQGVARRLEFLANVLELTVEQKAQVAAVLEESVAARRAVLEALRDGTIEIEDALYQGYVIATRTADAIRALLTPEQAAIFDALKRLLPGHCAP
jgi:Spy/CpxP family protein refolding chaperone